MKNKTYEVTPIQQNFPEPFSQHQPSPVLTHTNVVVGKFDATTTFKQTSSKITGFLNRTKEIWKG
jgi:hypothetical protein